MNKEPNDRAPVERIVRYLGNFSAVDPAYSRYMECYDCATSWTGCWDNFQCPECGKGELPNSEINFASLKLTPNAELTRAREDAERNRDASRRRVE